MLIESPSTYEIRRQLHLPLYHSFDSLLGATLFFEQYVIVQSLFRINGTAEQVQ